MWAITFPAWMIAATAAGAPAGAAARPSAPIVPAPGGGGAICPVGWSGRFADGPPLDAVLPVCVERSETAPAMPPERAAFLSTRTSRCVSTPSTRSPAARSNRRTLVRVAGPNCPSVAAR